VHHAHAHAGQLDQEPFGQRAAQRDVVVAEHCVHRMFPDCAVVVFGHSHAPVDELGVDGQRLFNPGSPTQRRRQPHPSFGLLDFDAGQVTHHRIVVLD
jgi:predicted phosphodiesterase